MKTLLLAPALALFGALAILPTAQATDYPGNGNTDFGGPIGQGSLNLSNDGTTITGTLTRGAGNFNDVLVLYIDTGVTGFADTSGFADSMDGLRKAISGFDGGTNRSTLTFSGMTPSYAIALGPSSDSYGGLWQLANGGANSLPFVAGVNLMPLGSNNAATYTFSFPVSQIGLTPNSGATFKILGTYIANSGYRSGEALAGNVSGTTGWNPFSQTAVATYTIAGGLVPPQAVSRKTHTGVGDFDIPLPLTGPVGIECRQGGATNDYQMVATFTSPVTVTSTSVNSGTGSISSATGSGSNTITVNLTGVTDQQTITVGLNGVSDGVATGNVAIPMGVLVGDTNGNGTVNAGDTTQTRGRSGQTADATNFRSDVNTSGVINSGDQIAVRSRAGNFLP